MQTSIIDVSGIDSTNSALTVKNAITSVAGVSNVAVDANSSKVTITFDPSTTDLSTIKDAIEDTGFNVTLH